LYSHFGNQKLPESSLFHYAVWVNAIKLRLFTSPFDKGGFLDFNHLNLPSLPFEKGDNP
jgi:hypothetical protein